MSQFSEVLFSSGNWEPIRVHACTPKKKYTRKVEKESTRFTILRKRNTKLIKDCRLDIKFDVHDNLKQQKEQHSLILSFWGTLHVSFSSFSSMEGYVLC